MASMRISELHVGWTPTITQAPPQATKARTPDTKLCKRMVGKNPCKGCCAAVANDAAAMLPRTPIWTVVERMVGKNPCKGCCAAANEAEAMMPRTVGVGMDVEPTDLPSLQPLRGSQIGCADPPRRLFTPWPSGILGVLILLIVVGVTLWYRRRHRQVAMRTLSRHVEGIEKAQAQDEPLLERSGLQLDESD